MSGADWDLISELLQFPNSSDEILSEHRQRAAAHGTVHDAPAVAHAKRSAKTRAKPNATGSAETATVDVSHEVTNPAHVASAPAATADPVTLLLGSLDAAVDDVERERLLQAAPYELRTALDSYLTYRTLMSDCAREAEAQRKSFSAFTDALDACNSDDARVVLIHGAPPAFLAEWSWRQTASDDAWVKRYLALTGTDKGY